MTKKILIDETVVKQVLGWIEDAAVVLSHTSTAIQGGLGAEAEGVGGCSVKVLKDLREALEVNNKGVNALAEQAAWLPSAEWTACVKLPVTVHVRQQRPGETHVSTREGITPVKPDDLIMLGVSGEEYPIGREIFERTYRIGEAYEAGKSVVQQEPTEPQPSRHLLLEALARLKIRIAFIGWPAESMWNVGTDSQPRWVPDWRYESQLIEHLLNGAEITAPENPADTKPANEIHPAPTQQPLTDEQIDRIADQHPAYLGSVYPHAFARAIEAAHGITSTNQGE